MTDIIKRLTSPDEANDENICRLLDDAVAEIERLRAELDKRLDPGQIELLFSSLEEATGCSRDEIVCQPFQCARGVANQRAEIERLRVKLEMERDAWKDACEFIMETLGNGGQRGRPMDLIDRQSWREIKTRIGMAEHGLGKKDIERDL